MPAPHDILSDRAATKELFAIVDGAACEGLLQLLEGNEDDFRCLYRGELDDDLRNAAPYLVRLEPATPLARAILENTWGGNSAIFPVAQRGAEIEDVMHHFRKLAKVRGPRGEAWLFRYYDPRVLRVFLPTCDAAQTAAFFHPPVERILCEGESETEILEFVPADSGSVECHPLAENGSTAP